MLKPYDYQLEIADNGYKIITKENIVYLAHEERVGKSIPSILICDKIGAKKVLIITKRKAYKDWSKLLQNLDHECLCELTTYHSTHKIMGKDFDVVILDEAHNNISGYPKPGPLWFKVSEYTQDTKIIYISATPDAEGAQLLFHQFALSSYSPWKHYKNFYKWFKDYGIPKKVLVRGLLIETYKKVKNDKIIADTQHLFLRKTRKEVGFKYEPINKIHYVELSDYTKKFYNTLLTKKLVKVKLAGKIHILVADSTIQLLHYLYMLEGGTTKITKKVYINNKVKKEESFYSLKNNEKIKYIKEKFPNESSLVIMYNYVAEGKKLALYFKQAKLLQATSHAEGIDLSSYDHLVIYSQDFSTARYSQRRARQANKKRDKPITIHYLLAKEAISEQVYDSVVKKHQNFTARRFKNRSI